MENNLENLDQEIAHIEKHIAERRTNLEAESNIVDEFGRKIVHQAIDEKYFKTDRETAGRGHSPSASYLGLLADEDRQTVNELENLAEQKSVKQAVSESKKYSPFIIDAFHDLLVEKIFKAIKNKQ